MKPSYCMVAVENPKSPQNMGAILRAMGCFDGDEIRYSGHRYDRAAKFSTDTKDRATAIPLQHRDDLLAKLPEDLAVVAVELVPGATSLSAFQHPKRAMYLFGPEDGSLQQDQVTRADHVVYVPTVGCLNLAATVNIVLYDRQAKLHCLPETEELIIKSRDRNNNLSA